MKRLFSARSLAATALALGAVGAASVAHARSDVILSIGINAPFGYGYAQPAPVYVEQQPVYVQPRPVYIQPQPVYVQPQPVYVQPRPIYVQPQTSYYGHDRRWQRTGAYGDWDRDGVPNRFDRDSRHYDQRVGHRRGAWGDWGDWDRDGVPNRQDRAPNNPYRY